MIGLVDFSFKNKDKIKFFVLTVWFVCAKFKRYWLRKNNCSKNGSFVPVSIQFNKINWIFSKYVKLSQQNFINFENDTVTLCICPILTTEPPPSKNYYYSHITSHQTKLSLKWITNNKYQQNFVNFLLKFNI